MEGQLTVHKFTVPVRESIRGEVHNKQGEYTYRLLYKRKKLDIFEIISNEKFNRRMLKPS